MATSETVVVGADGAGRPELSPALAAAVVKAMRFLAAKERARRAALAQDQAVEQVEAGAVQHAES